MIPYISLRYYITIFLIGLTLGGTLMYFIKKDRVAPASEKVTLKKGESKISVVKGKETKKEKWVEKTNAAVLNNPDTAITTHESRYRMFLKDSSYTGTIDIVTHPRTDSVHIFTDIKVREVERLRTDTVLISRTDTLERVITKTVLKPNLPAMSIGFAAGVIVTAITALIIAL